MVTESAPPSEQGGDPIEAARSVDAQPAPAYISELHPGSYFLAIYTASDGSEITADVILTPSLREAADVARRQPAADGAVSIYVFPVAFRTGVRLDLAVAPR